MRYFIVRGILISITKKIKETENSKENIKYGPLSSTNGSKISSHPRPPHLMGSCRRLRHLWHVLWLEPWACRRVTLGLAMATLFIIVLYTTFIFSYTELAFDIMVGHVSPLGKKDGF
jgi:hypothetical protein